MPGRADGQSEQPARLQCSQVTKQLNREELSTVGTRPTYRTRSTSRMYEAHHFLLYLPSSGGGGWEADLLWGEEGAWCEFSITAPSSAAASASTKCTNTVNTCRLNGSSDCRYSVHALVQGRAYLGLSSAEVRDLNRPILLVRGLPSPWTWTWYSAQRGPLRLHHCVGTERKGAICHF